MKNVWLWFIVFLAILFVTTYVMLDIGIKYVMAGYHEPKELDYSVVN